MSDSEDIETGSNEVESDPAVSKFQVLMGSLAVVCVGVSVGCLAIAEDYIMYIVAGITIIIAPLSNNTYKDYRNKWLVAQTAEGLKKNEEDQANALKGLGKSTQQLGESSARIKELEEMLNMITSTQGQNIEKLERQVKDNEKIAKKMQGELKTIVLQSLITIIIANDKDGDFHIDPEEVGPMCEALKEVTKSMKGVTFYEENFHKTVSQNKNGIGIKEMMGVIKDMEKAGTHGPIFEFSTEGEEQKEDG